jgi:SH3-like domain-containing protein
MTASAKLAPMRQQPRANARAVGTLKRGDVVRTLERRGDWVRVRHDNGKTGWVARGQLWGG